MFLTLTAIATCLSAAAASAQSTYVAAAVGADAARFGSVVTDGQSWLEVSGEVPAMALRGGTAVRESWGVELEFVYPARHRVEAIQDSPVVVNPTSRGSAGAFFLTAGGVADFRVVVERRNATVGAAAWVAQGTGRPVEVRYLAGISMHRFTQDKTVDVIPRGRPVQVSGNVGDTSEVDYRMGPMAGVEARWAVSGPLFINAGVRLHGFTGGWILRPSVGAGWAF